MFKAFDIPYRSIDLDSVAYQENDWGGQIRVALNAQTGIKTIPQIFVGGEFVGGCTELFDAHNDGSLETLLEKNAVQHDTALKKDAYSFLPAWLQPR